MRDIDETKLELLRTIKFDKNSYIQDCVIVKDGKMIFTSGNRSMVLVYSSEGQLSKSINVGKSPFGLSVTSTNTVAVACREDKMINIVNIDDGVAMQKMHVGKSCFAHTGIMELDSVGHRIRIIPTYVPSDECYLSSNKDKFCYTCYNRFISCCDSNGKEIWRRGVADSGVAVDNCGNYFAANCNKNTLYIISADGKKQNNF
ncbi:unnamed protein product [Mytilus coruscus]|uniref:Uncharacterized protein n=1 Tax=Mytilus coruscus TaxID=42192 RepID=A0A6J8ECC1_MYTCO|nr:unnamed protein product [Mytilus coruscus]